VDSPAFHRLVKAGIGTLYIDSDSVKALNHHDSTVNLGALGADFGLTTAFEAGLPVHVPGAWHTGGTELSHINDYLKGSLGRTWEAPLDMRAAIRTPAGLPPLATYNPTWFVRAVDLVTPGGYPFNPLRITGDGHVVVNRSQFFTDFNATEDASFEGRFATWNVNFKPQIRIAVRWNAHGQL
jgi:hypothetical protein